MTRRGLFGALLGGIAAGIGVRNVCFADVMDATTASYPPGPFVFRGTGPGAIKFKLGEWKIVNVPGRTIREAIVPLDRIENT